MAEPETLLWRSRQAKPDDAFPSLTFTLQTLLVRHEAYMASAERDRLELTTRIEQLERDNTELEARNKSVTDENHALRDELEQINETVKESETRIGLLEVTLLDSQRELRRLENATDRAASLERQIAVLEEEQVVLRTTIARTEEEARTTMYRWRQAEKGLNDLQDQLERMEKETREERERHVEVMGRMQRQRVMEKELNTAAGRLKGAAAVKSMTDSKNSGNVVSHFVRDLLQDNAHLQVGMAELREMLLSSNDEIQMLREQLMYHQPAAGNEPSPHTTLQAELANKEPPTSPQAPRVSQELHIHHHYHVTHKPDARKPRKRRQGLNPGVFAPPQFSAPASPIMSSARFQRGTLAGPLLSPPSNDSSVY
jgi:DNA repair exonuclease SbcCD ATPase subunit